MKATFVGEIRIKGRYPRNLTDEQQRKRLARNNAARVRRAQRKAVTR